MLETSRDFNSLVDEYGVEKFIKDFQLQTAKIDHNIYGKPVCNILEPLFLSSSSYGELLSAAVAVKAAIDVIELAAHRSCDLLHKIVGKGRLFDLAKNKPPHAHEFVGRLDGFYTEKGGLKFIEYNPGSVGGMFFSDACLAIFDALIPIQKLQERFQFAGVHLSRRYIQSLWRAAEFAGVEAPFELALILPPDASAKTLIASPEVRDMLRAHNLSGGSWRFVAPDELRVQGNALWAKREKLQAALVLDWTKMLELLPNAHPIWAAAEGDGTWLGREPISGIPLATEF